MGGDYHCIVTMLPSAPMLNSPVTSATLQRAGWSGRLALRMRRLFWLKALGVTLWVWVFFIGYFHVLRHPVHEVTTMPLTAIDAWIDFEPRALPIYLSLWFYVGIAPGLMWSLRELLYYGAWTAALCATGLAFFYALPTTITPYPVDTAAYPMFGVLRGIDAAGNACPSMHVAAALFSSLWIARLLADVRAPAGLQAMNIVWLALIAWSTIAVRQHVVLDVLAGAALGLLFALPSLRWRPRVSGPV
jgi:hypothetical protein